MENSQQTVEDKEEIQEVQQESKEVQDEPIQQVQKQEEIKEEDQKDVPTTTNSNIEEMNEIYQKQQQPHVHGPNCNHDDNPQEQQQGKQPHVHGPNCSHGHGHGHPQLTEEQQAEQQRLIANMQANKIREQIESLQKQDIVANRRQIKQLENSLEIYRKRDFWDTQPVPPLFGQNKGQNQTIPRLVKLYKLPKKSTLKGLREMKKRDIIPMTKLLQKHLSQFRYQIVFNQEEVMHWFLPRDKVIYTYVVEKDKKVTDIISFYYLPSSVLQSKKYDAINAAYCFYNVATSCTQQELMKNALILAKQNDFDVFNALDILDNKKGFDDLIFHGGSGNLHFYLYNWNVKSQFNPEEVGIVLL